jgi:hypothetical protein
MKKSNRKCSLENCENKHLAKGLCQKHYTLEYGKKLREWNARMDKIELKGRD